VHRAPLFDPTGEFMGVLDVSALRSPEARESQHLTRHLTVMYAQMVDDSNFCAIFTISGFCAWVRLGLGQCQRRSHWSRSTETE